jgi:signal transduction histidine kinase
MPDRRIAGLFEDSRGRIWLSTLAGTGYLENSGFISVPVPAIADAMVEDASGNLWLSYQYEGLFRLSLHNNDVQQIPWSAFGSKDPADPLALDPSRNGLWLGFFRDGVALFRDGKVRASYTAANGLGAGRVTDLRFDNEGALWISTQGGLSRLKNGHISTLTSRNGLPCDAVQWTLEDDLQSVWLNTPCGMVRIGRSELEAWAATPGKVLRTAVFDSSDGARSVAELGGYTPRAARSTDGKLWFANLEGLGMIDPDHLPLNRIPPPVHVEQITADGRMYDATLNEHPRLPPLVRTLEIDYTALSLVAPEKIRFRYKLEGHDRDWQDVGNRRQAFYSDLAPRNYRFRVAASNNSGVWNEAGAYLDFSVAPAYYQTTWFRSLVVAALLAFLGAIYQLRLRQVTRQFNVRMEERVNERTRIARDLHDTMLQSFQGVLLKFHAVTYMLPDRPEARSALEGVIEQARNAITEGREALEGLRSSTIVTNDLAEALGTLGEGLVADHGGNNSPDFRLQVEGESRDLRPIVRDEVYRIMVEALRNAFRHSHAKRIEMEIRYDQRQLRLRVRDDGKGIDRKVLNEGGRAGHYGLRGMHERAGTVGGKLTVWSEMDSGTEVELSVPASIAYAKLSSARRATAPGNTSK